MVNVCRVNQGRNGKVFQAFLSSAEVMERTTLLNN